MHILVIPPTHLNSRPPAHPVGRRSGSVTLCTLWAHLFNAYEKVDSSTETFKCTNAWACPLAYAKKMKTREVSIHSKQFCNQWDILLHPRYCTTCHTSLNLSCSQMHCCYLRLILIQNTLKTRCYRYSSYPASVLHLVYFYIPDVVFLSLIEMADHPLNGLAVLSVKWLAVPEPHPQRTPRLLWAYGVGE